MDTKEIEALPGFIRAAQEREQTFAGIDADYHKNKLKVAQVLARLKEED